MATMKMKALQCVGVSVEENEQAKVQRALLWQNFLNFVLNLLIARVHPPLS